MNAGTVSAVAAAADSEAPREERARAAADIVRDARGFRWVGIFDIGDDEVALIGFAGQDSTSNPDIGREAVRSRATVTSGFQSVVPILGAESGIAIGTLAATRDRAGAVSSEDVAFLEECAAALRALYD